MNVVTIAINDLFDFEGQAVPTVRPDNDAVSAMVKRQFGCAGDVPNGRD